MDKMIYKYILNKYGYTNISVPSVSEVLTAQLQDGDLVVWILHDTNYNLIEKEFYTVYNGMPFYASNKKYINTVQDNDGVVYHVFETIPTII